MLDASRDAVASRRRHKENLREFIARKREIFLVQMTLDNKRAEIRKLVWFVLANKGECLLCENSSPPQHNRRSRLHSVLLHWTAMKRPCRKMPSVLQHF